MSKVLFFKRLSERVQAKLLLQTHPELHRKLVHDANASLLHPDRICLPHELMKFLVVYLYTHCYKDMYGINAYIYT